MPIDDRLTPTQPPSPTTHRERGKLNMVHHSNGKKNIIHHEHAGLFYRVKNMQLQEQKDRCTETKTELNPRGIP